jgi:hypothetical protein
MDTATCIQAFTCPGFLSDLRALDTPSARDEEKGLSAAQRLAISAEYCTFHDQLVSPAAWLSASPPQSNVMGLPRRCLAAMRWNADSLAHFRACYPRLRIKERNANNYDLEGFFGDVTMRNHGQKPDMCTASGLMYGLDVLSEIRDHPNRGFRFNYSRRAAYDQSEAGTRSTR